MSHRRRKHSAEFKAQVVLEMLKGTETLSELAGKYEVHPTQLTKWRRAFLERAPEIFSEKSSKREKAHAQVNEELYKKIGQLQVELDWLKKKSSVYL
jgi:transposase-like protein